MIKYTIHNIAEILSASCPKNAEDKIIEHLLIDSRKIAFPETSLFFALTGERHNGHDYISDVYKAGVKYFIISQDIDYQLFKNAIFLKVPDTLKAFQDLTAYHRSQFPNLKVIGITGSNGKTIVKEWLFELLKNEFDIVRSPKSWNSQVGVPLSVWQIEEKNTLGIFEAGISQTGEMENLEQIIQPTIGILTSLGTAHAEGFSSDEEKLKEKLRLFQHVKTLICPQDIVLKYPQLFKNKKCLTWSKTSEADVQVIDFQFFKNKTQADIIFENKKYTLTIPFTDTASIDNILTCCLTLLHLKYTPSVITEKIAHLGAVGMRLELKAGINNCLVVNDAYSADLNALQIALDFIVQQGLGRSRTVILSDILQSGLTPSVLYKKVAVLLAEKSISKVVAIGENIAVLNKYLPKEIDYQYFKTNDDFLNKIKNTDYQNEIILVKGARIFQFEKIVERLALKAHKTVLEINLNALAHNLLVYNRLLTEGVKTMAMVKASAYGNGSEEVARLLEFHKTDYLAVAYADEGITLRQAGIKLPIMVMNPEEASFDAMRRYNLEPEIYSLNILKNFVAYAQDYDEAFKIHLKLDTGMHRLGFELPDIQALIEIFNLNKNIKIASVFTHLVASDAVLHDGFTHQQIERFTEMYAILTEGVGYKPMRHVLNSGGISRFKDYQFEMVRLGIGLYGIDGNELIQSQLHIVQTLKATISQIKNIPQTETVGYSRRGILDRASRIATISIGYADGLLRGASVGNFAVWLHGKRAPIVGNVCMDMTMIDVTNVPEAQEGDEVEIFGQNLPVQELAKALGTIPYEVFTNVSERVKRVYFQE